MSSAGLTILLTLDVNVSLVEFKFCCSVAIGSAVVAMNLTATTALPPLTLRDTSVEGTPYKRESCSLSCSPLIALTSSSSVKVVRSVNISFETLLVDEMPPVASWIGNDPGGVFVVSAAAPGQRKPLGGQASGTALPVGLQKPGSTGWQPLRALRPVRLEKVPPGHS